MSKDSLVGRVRKGLYAIAAVGALSLGCSDGDTIVDPPQNHTPQTIFSVNPTSGVSPLKSRIQYTCTDSDGPQDIAESYLVVGKDTIQTTSIDSTFIFTQSSTSKAYCNDRLGAEAIAGPIDVEVTQPPVNNPPQATLTVNPTSGVAPLEVRVQYACTDPDGIGDIVQSYLAVGSDTVTTTSTDATYTLNESKTVTGYCKDKAGEESTVGPIEVEVIQPPEPMDQIAFWRLINGNEDIYMGDFVDGGLVNVQRLTIHPGQDLEPTWSPNGEYIAWATNRDGLLSIYSMKMDKTDLRKLTPSINTSFLSPSWSPDGTEVSFSFTDWDLGTNGIAKMNIDGSGLTKLIENSGIGTAPGGIHWSEDGRIFYHDFMGGSFELFSIDSSGNSKVRITDTPYNELLPSISPDGNTLVLVSDQFGGEFSGLEIMSMATDGTDIKRITNTFEMEVDPTYSNDGSSLLYSRWLSSIDAWQMFLANSDGSGEILLGSGLGRYAVFRPGQ